MRKTIIIIFSVFIGITIIAQEDVSKLPPKKIIKAAEDALLVGDVYTAADNYEEYLKKVPGDMEIKYKLAHLYRDAKDYSTALKYFKELYDTMPEQYVKSMYYEAEILKIQGNYKEALDKFENFRKEYRGRDLSRHTRNQIEGCEAYLENKQENRNIDILHVDNTINKPYIEFSPYFLSQNTLIYGSLPSDTIPYILKTDKGVTIPFRKIYQAKRGEDIDWISDGEFNGGKYNSNDANTGNVAVSLDKKRLYFTKCIPDWQNKVHCNIYMARRDSNGNWGEAEKLGYPVNVEDYSSSMPAIGSKTSRGRTREILYFVSDRPYRNQGGKDIYYSLYEPTDSSFGKVKPCGRRINSPGDEITPFYDITSQTLYFSSDYWPGYGGFDIFKIRGSGRRWKRPSNIGMPINSGYDDVYFVLNLHKKEEGAFTSNRKAGNSIRSPHCCDDLFSFIDKDYIKIGVEGLVYDIPQDADSNDIGRKVTDPLEGAVAMLFMVTENEETGEEDLMYITADTTVDDGYYFIGVEKGEDYKIMFKKDGYFYANEEFSTVGMDRSDTIELNPVNLEEIPTKPIVFYVYYETNKFELSEEAKNTIDTTMFKILDRTPDIIVEISSHTDSIDTEEYNLELSQKRAESVKNYLINKGIDPERLIAKGYGESQPIADNGTEKGRALNRRTEFKVVGSLDPFSKLNKTGLQIIKKVKEGEIERNKDKEDSK